MSLQNQFPHIYAIAKDKTILLENAYRASTHLVWDVFVTRNLQYWEAMEYENLLWLFADAKVGTEPDRLSWKLCKKGSFTVKSLYRYLNDSTDTAAVFPHKIIWNSNVPPRISVFAWEAALGCILTLDSS